MAKLVTKISYLRPGKKNRGNYLKYIATREGVEKIDRSKKNNPATGKQKEIIKNLLSDYPDCKNMLEYEDFLQEPSIAKASEFISRAVEENTGEEGRGGYTRYIATRPRTEKFGSHGLFTNEGEEINLANVVDEVNRHQGNVWTIIISLRREDAERLGFNRGARWRDLLRSDTTMLASAFKVPLRSLRWYAAFHNEGSHPHVHLVVYAKDAKAYLSKSAVEEIRSTFGKEIFKQDLLSVYERETQHRNMLRRVGKDKVKELVDRIHSEAHVDSALEEKMLRLAAVLSRTEGKKQYGYLKANVKVMVCEIVDKLASDPRISALYDLWYEQREEVIRTYTDEVPPRVPLSENKEFRPILNAVIAEAVELQNSLNEKEHLEVDSSKAASEETNEDIDEYKPANDANHYRAESQDREARLVSESGSRLLIALCGLLSAQMYDQPWTTIPKVESKLRKKINEKKIAHGQKIERGFSGGEIHPVQ